LRPSPTPTLFPYTTLFRSIFGPDTPKINTGQNALAIPTTVYGISKRAGEFWCNYYHEKFGVDVRSIRYPGLISWKTRPGGGTTEDRKSTRLNSSHVKISYA